MINYLLHKAALAVRGQKLSDAYAQNEASHFGMMVTAARRVSLRRTLGAVRI
jgi:hypothetical protein